MTVISRLLFRLLAHCFVLSILLLSIAWLCVNDSWMEGLFGAMGLFSSIVTIYLFLLHLLSLLIGLFLKRK